LAGDEKQDSPEVPGGTAERARAFDDLFEAVCEELRARASALCKRERVPVFATFDLVNDVYLKFRKHPTYSLEIAARSRQEFLWVISKAMRFVLIDAARKVGQCDFVTLSAADGKGRVRLSAEQLLDLDRALEVLGKKHPRQAEMITMRYFGGLSVEEVKECWRVSKSTAERELRDAMRLLNALLGVKRWK
jgi:RNA polymerase sigma factor (TIGR02999 family)